MHRLMRQASVSECSGVRIAGRPSQYADRQRRCPVSHGVGRAYGQPRWFASDSDPAFFVRPMRYALGIPRIDRSINRQDQDEKSAHHICGVVGIGEQLGSVSGYVERVRPSPVFAFLGRDLPDRRGACSSRDTICWSDRERILHVFLDFDLLAVGHALVEHTAARISSKSHLGVLADHELAWSSPGPGRGGSSP